MLVALSVFAVVSALSYAGLARALETKSGSLLLADGLWAYGRKLHYTCDVAMALSWGLVCGFEGTACGCGNASHFEIISGDANAEQSLWFGFAGETCVPTAIGCGVFEGLIAAVEVEVVGDIQRVLAAVGAHGPEGYQTVWFFHCQGFKQDGFDNGED